MRIDKLKKVNNLKWDELLHDTKSLRILKTSQNLSKRWENINFHEKLFFLWFEKRYPENLKVQNNWEKSWKLKIFTKQ